MADSIEKLREKVAKAERDFELQERIYTGALAYAGNRFEDRLNTYLFDTSSFGPYEKGALDYAVGAQDRWARVGNAWVDALVELREAEEIEAKNRATIAGQEKNNPKDEKNKNKEERMPDAANPDGSNTATAVPEPGEEDKKQKFTDPRNAMLRDVFFISENNHLKIKTSSHYIYNGQSQTEAAAEEICGPILFDPEVEAVECEGGGGSGGVFTWSSSCVDFMGKMLFKKVGAMDSDPAIARVCADAFDKVTYRDKTDTVQVISGVVRDADNAGGIIVKTEAGAEIFIPTHKVISTEALPARIRNVDITRKFPVHGFWYPSSPALRYTFTPIIPPQYPAIPVPGDKPGGGDDSGDNARVIKKSGDGGGGDGSSGESQKKFSIATVKGTTDAGQTTPVRGGRTSDGVPVEDDGKPKGGGGGGGVQIGDPATKEPPPQDPLDLNPDPKNPLNPKDKKPIIYSPANNRCYHSGKTVVTSTPGLGPNGNSPANPTAAGGACVVPGAAAGPGAPGTARGNGGNGPAVDSPTYREEDAPRIPSADEDKRDIQRAQNVVSAIENALAVQKQKLADLINGGGTSSDIERQKRIIEELELKLAQAAYDLQQAEARAARNAVDRGDGATDPTKAPSTASGASSGSEIQPPNPSGGSAPNLDSETTPGNSITNLENDIKKINDRIAQLERYLLAIEGGQSVSVFEGSEEKTEEEIRAEIEALKDRVAKLGTALTQARAEAARAARALRLNTAVGKQTDNVRNLSGTSNSFTGLISELRSQARNKTANVSSIDIAKIVLGEHNIYSQIMAMQIQKNADVAEANNVAAQELIESFDVQGGWGCTTSLSAFTTAEAEEGTGVFRGITA